MKLFGDSTDFITDANIYAAVVSLIGKAEKRIVIVSPYLDMPATLQRTLEDRASHHRQSPRIAVFFREDKLADYLTQPWLAALGNAGVQFYTIPLLHAKLYTSESAAILTSMNLVNFSKDNSHEVGVQVSSNTSLYKQIDDYLEKLVKRATRVTIPEPKARNGRTSERAVKLPADEQETIVPGMFRPPATAARSGSSSSGGFCLGCASEVPFDTDKPFCRSCYRGEANAVYCHKCGDNAKVSLEKPLCYPCFKSQ